MRSRLDNRLGHWLDGGIYGVLDDCGGSHDGNLGLGRDGGLRHGERVLLLLRQGLGSGRGRDKIEAGVAATGFFADSMFFAMGGLSGSRVWNGGSVGRRGGQARQGRDYTRLVGVQEEEQNESPS